MNLTVNNNVNNPNFKSKFTIPTGKNLPDAVAGELRRTILTPLANKGVGTVTINDDLCIITEHNEHESANNDKIRAFLNQYKIPSAFNKYFGWSA